MAKATAHLTCSRCGAEYIRTKICYNRADANSWESWMESHQEGNLCTQCYFEEQKEKEAELRDKLESELSLPALTGTEKQIKWARDIRAKLISDAVRFMDGNKATELYKQFRSWLDNQPSASWWIDHRDSTTKDLAVIWHDRKES